MTGYTYILRCFDGTFYVGSTRGLDRRLAHAQRMGSAYTACRLPLTLVWFREFDRVDASFGLEKWIQGRSNTKRLAFIEGGFDAVKGGVPVSGSCPHIGREPSHDCAACRMSPLLPGAFRLLAALVTQ